MRLSPFAGSRVHASINDKCIAFWAPFQGASLLPVIVVLPPFELDVFPAHAGARPPKSDVRISPRHTRRRELRVSPAGGSSRFADSWSACVRRLLAAALACARFPKTPTDQRIPVLLRRPTRAKVSAAGVQHAACGATRRLRPEGFISIDGLTAVVRLTAYNGGGADQSRCRLLHSHTGFKLNTRE
jgi:hypothetical protein